MNLPSPKSKISKSRKRIRTHHSYFTKFRLPNVTLKDGKWVLS